ncbi:MAG: hypothetical protein LBS01_10970 [Prevotellaceae bacterium]|jgi:hypothetical protein|nr:hypothetical protein [Prevotellaceae bacterium]
MNKKIFLTIAMATALILSGCKNTNEDLVQQRGAGATPVVSELSPGFFTDDFQNSKINFRVSLPEGQTVDASWIEVGFKGKKAKLKDVAIPSNVTVSATETMSALGLTENDVHLGDAFDVTVITDVDGLVTRSLHAAISVSVACALDPALTVGSYKAESADWAFAGAVTLEADADDPNKIYINGYPQAEGLSGNGNRIELNINPNTWAVTGPAVVLADDLSEWGLPYTNYTYEPKGGSYNSCDGSYTVTFAIYVDQGSFSNNVFVFTRAE